MANTHAASSGGSLTFCAVANLESKLTKLGIFFGGQAGQPLAAKAFMMAAGSGFHPRGWIFSLLVEAAWSGPKRDWAQSCSNG